MRSERIAAPKQIGLTEVDREGWSGACEDLVNSGGQPERVMPPVS